MNPLALLAWLVPHIDAMAEWSPQGPEPGEVEACAADRQCADDLLDPAKPGTPPSIYPQIDVERQAAAVKYDSGIVKRTRYPVVDLRRRTVLIALHQAGVERSEGRWLDSVHRVTCHRAIGPSGNRYRVHPIDRRLVCTNRFDRDPWHAIGIEVLGNFEGVDGSGKWYKPEIFGRGRAGEAQIAALREEIAAICSEVDDAGAVVAGIVPHRIAGVDSKGKPNRPICCGSRVWSQAGEWAGAKLGLRVPADGFAVGGLPIAPEWHGEFWPDCGRLLAA